MNYRNVEDKTQANQTAERFVALLEEYGTYEDRLQKALAHKEAFSEKVLAKVTGEYKSKMDQLTKERSVLEAQLQAELSAFERQLQAALPARQRYHEEIEELELRHITGELPTKDYTRRKAALEAQKPGGAATETIQRNIDYYRGLLQGTAPLRAPAEAEGEEQEYLEPDTDSGQQVPDAPAEAAWDQVQEVENSLPELEDKPNYVEDSQPVPAGWGETEFAVEEPLEFAHPAAELEAEEDYFAAQLAEPELDTEGSYFEPGPAVAAEGVEEGAEDLFAAEEDIDGQFAAEGDLGDEFAAEEDLAGHFAVEDDVQDQFAVHDDAQAQFAVEAAPAEEVEYYDPAAVAEELDADDGFYAEVAEDAAAEDGLEPLAEVPESSEEEEYFQSEFDQTAQGPSDPAWYASPGLNAPAGAYVGRLQPESDSALEDLDEFGEEAGFAGEDVEIPEELLMDEEEDFLEPESMDDSAALLQSTNQLLDDESFEDVFDDEIVDGDTGARALEPALVLREGMPDEKIFFMTNNVLSIGRGPDNDIQLSTDTSVSRHHSRITYEDDEYWISDLGSSNGTIVNGARVSKTVLTGDDEISIGQTVLKFKFC